MRVDAATSLVLEGKLQLLSAGDRHGLAGKERAIVGNDRPLSVAILDVNGTTIQVIAVRSEHIRFRAVLRNCFDRKNESILERLDRNLKLYALARTEAPGDESVAIRELRVAL